MPTVNEQYFDALLRHQIGLLRLSGSIRNRIFAILDATEDDLAAQITRRLATTTGIDSPAAVQRLQRLLREITTLRLTAWSQVTDVWVEELLDLARAEPGFAAGILRTVSPVVLSDLAMPSVEALTAIVRARPFEGKTLREWAKKQATADLDRITSQVRIGLVQGESSRQIASRVVGTRAAQGRNGVTQITRNQATAITRTAVNHVSNQARREFLKENSDIFAKEQYVATLDARTTMICASLDGTFFPVGRGEIPPLHFQCRSIRVGVLDGEVLGERPVKPFTEKQFLREYTKANQLSPTTDRAGLPHGHKGLFDSYSRTRVRELTGTAPASVNYQTWLTRQSTSFQNDVLGPTRATLFRKGGLNLTKFVNRKGDEIPLWELARKHKSAFRAAGLDPEDFL